MAQYNAVSASATASPLLNLLRWLSAHAKFPASRLAPRAELLLILTAAAAFEEAAVNARTPVQRRELGKDPALRAHALRRSMVHYRCDNSAKV